MSSFSLIPKNDAYFTDFREAMELVVVIAREVEAAVAAPALPADLFQRVQVSDDHMRGVVRRCLHRLDSSFVTPIEREDIHALIHHVSDVGEMLHIATSQFDIYAIDAGDETLRQMAAKIVEMAVALTEAIGSLKSLDPNTVRPLTGKVRRLEDEVDVLYREAIRALFARRPEAYDLVRWKDVYESLENAADRARTVARTVEHILVRHS